MRCTALHGILFLIAAACTQQKETTVVVEENLPVPPAQSLPGKATLSAYGFFTGELKNLQPAERVFAYELNSPLFSDYAFKKRFIYLPPGASVNYHPTDVLEFPEGTVIIKNFYYPADFRNPGTNLRILETRLLILENGSWKALPYIWNEEQTEAYLDVSGKNIEVQWIHFDGSARKVNYSIPNMNQCKGCHLRGDRVFPIGPLARQLNKTVNGQNQLARLASLGVLKSLPPLPEVPRLADYEDTSAPLDSRARAWLEVNCAHCHRPDGPAKNSGLHLTADVTKPFELGIGKPPVAAGRGSGGLHYDIVPGHPEKSILYYRITSTDPGIMMPELGKKLVHEEGVQLIRDWIASLK
ncbi:MAG: hypothetical protein NZM13_08125 [Cyclobacteriaceae bacterium]|nr:hypothetical protein [Cyclobacteriaceae bacterium]